MYVASIRGWGIQEDCLHLQNIYIPPVTMNLKTFWHHVHNNLNLNFYDDHGNNMDEEPCYYSHNILQLNHY